MFNSKFQKVYRKLIAQQMEGIPDIRQNIKDEFMAITIMVQYNRDCNQQFITRKNGINLKTPINFIQDIFSWDLSEVIYDYEQPVNTMAIYEWLLEFYTMIDKFEKANKLRYGIIGSNGGCYSVFIFRKNDKQEILNSLPKAPEECISSIPLYVENAFYKQPEQCSINQFNACPLIGERNLNALKLAKYKNIFIKLNKKYVNQISTYLEKYSQFIPDEYITVQKK